MAPSMKTSPSVWGRFLSSMKGILRSSQKDVVGKLWSGGQASQAFDKGILKSEESGGKEGVRIAFRNVCRVPLLICWISDDLKLHHFYKLNPSIAGIENPMVCADDHIENSFSGDAFCFVYVPDEKDTKEIQKSKSLKDTSCIVGGFIGNPPSPSHSSEPLYLVTISNELDADKEEQVALTCCNPLFLRIGGKRKQTSASKNDNETTKKFLVRQQMAKVDPTPYDTSTKFYERKLLGGWPVYFEPNWHGGDLKIERRLASDLKNAAKILPPHAVAYLRENCPIWINSGIKYGPRACPIKGVGCCYHPEKEWLIENGLCPDKAKCVEINDGPGYTKDVDLWGPGGLMVHELSHAYHHRMLPDGYSNKEIRDCFEAAMKEGLYDCVKVHGKQGPTARAYACTNCMEYWAELSTAFLGGTEPGNEFNKWYPFNRQQLKEFDPRAYKLLSRLWKVSD